MGMKNVVANKEEIRKRLFQGESFSKIEKDLHLVKNDVQRYFAKITGEDPHKLKEEGEKKKFLSPDLEKVKEQEAEKVEQSDLEEINKQIKSLKKEIENLKKEVEDIKLEPSQSSKSSEQDITSFRSKYMEEKKEPANFRLTQENIKKLAVLAKKYGMSKNEVLNFIIDRTE